MEICICIGFLCFDQNKAKLYEKFKDKDFLRWSWIIGLLRGAKNQTFFRSNLVKSRVSAAKQYGILTLLKKNDYNSKLKNKIQLRITNKSNWEYYFLDFELKNVLKNAVSFWK